LRQKAEDEATEAADQRAAQVIEEAKRKAEGEFTAIIEESKEIAAEAKQR